jgi:heterotetrameric sarcosine oxidase delta subunit
MFLVPCPHCGPRNVSEFRHVGEATTRPDPAGTTPEQWRDYLYLRDNPAGWTVETWFHRAGCRAYFAAERDTVTNRFRQTWLPREGPPPAGQAAPLAGTVTEMGDGADAATGGGSPGT